MYQALRAIRTLFQNINFKTQRTLFNASQCHGNSPNKAKERIRHYSRINRNTNNVVCPMDVYAA